MEALAVPGAGVSADELGRLGVLVQQSLPAYLEDLARLVNIDCGSYTKAGVDGVGRWTALFLVRLGLTVAVHPNATLGDTIVGSLDGRPGGPRVLLIGHLDTVFPAGTAAQRPYRTEGGRAFGPGVTDMKSGLLAGLYGLVALRALAEATAVSGAWLPFERLTFVANPDEEIGSPASSPVIRELAREADCCLVLECARANGDIVSARKGTVDLQVTITGRAAHAGVEPEKGRSAILEAANQVQALHALNGRPTVPDTTVVVEELNRHWPMERLERSGRLVDQAQALASRIGFELRDAATGGASDANTTAGLGVPTLDGLGPIGGNDHAPTEYLELDSIVPRTTLLAALLLSIGRDPVVAGWRASTAAGVASAGSTAVGPAAAVGQAAASRFAEADGQRLP